jgi:hypothetical protein
MDNDEMQIVAMQVCKNGIERIEKMMDTKFDEIIQSYELIFKNLDDKIQAIFEKYHILDKT